MPITPYILLHNTTNLILHQRRIKNNKIGICNIDLICL
nr:MAG TPA: hypothetical protein [Caudoviricetes sp.]